MCMSVKNTYFHLPFPLKMAAVKAVCWTARTLIGLLLVSKCWFILMLLCQFHVLSYPPSRKNKEFIKNCGYRLWSRSSSKSNWLFDCWRSYLPWKKCHCFWIDRKYVQEKKGHSRATEDYQVDIFCVTTKILANNIRLHKPPWRRKWRWSANIWTVSFLSVFKDGKWILFSVTT